MNDHTIADSWKIPGPVERPLMHAHDRTYLASMGFADPDKKDRRHDMACQYFATPLAHEQIGEMLRKDGSESERDRLSRCTGLGPAFFEVVIRKGEGQYRTIMGFLDLTLGFGSLEGRTHRRAEFTVVVEVKIHPVSIGEILRQIGYYREFYQADAWIVATAFPLNKPEAAALKSAGIHHVILSGKFHEWVAYHQSEEAMTAEAAIEF